MYGTSPSFIFHYLRVVNVAMSGFRTMRIMGGMRGIGPGHVSCLIPKEFSRSA